MSDIQAPAATAAPTDAVDTSQDVALENTEVEGDEPDAPVAPKENVAEKKANKKKFKLKVDGKEYDEEVDLDNDDYIVKQLQLAKAAQKRMSEFSTLEKEVTSFLQELKKNPRKVLADPRIGLDVKKLAAEIIEEEIQNSQKSPEQLEKEKLQARLQELEDERKREQEDYKKKEFERIQANAYEQYDLQMSKALEKSDLPKSPYIVKKMADYMLLGLNNNIDVSPEDVLPLVREEMTNDLKEMFAVMPEEVIEAIIGKDVFSRIRKKNVAKAKAATSPLKSQIKDAGQKTEKGQGKETKINMKDFFGF